MPYKINYNNEQDYIAVTIEGEITLSTIKELAAGIARSIERNNCNRILNDMRSARLTENTFKIYNMPKFARQAGVATYLKRALVVSGLSSNFLFLETVFLNQGHIVKLFTAMDEALHWLVNKETTT